MALWYRQRRGEGGRWGPAPAASGRAPSAGSPAVPLRRGCSILRLRTRARAWVSEAWSPWQRDWLELGSADPLLKGRTKGGKEALGTGITTFSDEPPTDQIHRGQAEAGCGDLNQEALAMGPGLTLGFRVDGCHSVETDFSRHTGHICGVQAPFRCAGLALAYGPIPEKDAVQSCNPSWVCIWFAWGCGHQRGQTRILQESISRPGPADWGMGLSSPL